MRYITENDLKIFEEEEHLDKKVREASEAWLKEVKRSYKGEIKYENTRPLFDRYIDAQSEWKKYSDEHADILLAQLIK